MAVQQAHWDHTSASGQGPAYRIHTRRLLLRCWQPTDAPLLKAAIDANLAHLRAWLPWAQHEPEELPMKIERLRRCRGEFDLGEDFGPRSPRRPLGLDERPDHQRLDPAIG